MKSILPSLAHALSLLTGMALCLPARSVELQLESIGMYDPAKHGRTELAIHAVKVRDGYAFCASLAGLLILDVGDPANPRVVGRHGTPEDATALAISGNRIYVGYRGGLEVLDIADVRHPFTISKVSITHPSSDVAGLAVFQDVVLVHTTSGKHGTIFEMFDFRDAANPRRVPPSIFSTRLAMSGSYAYAAGGSDWTLFGLTSPTSPIVLANWTIQSGVADVAISGRFAYVTGEALLIYDLVDPLAPRLVGTLPLSNDYGHRIAVAGSHACIWTGFWDFFEIIDADDPAAPRKVAEINGIWVRDVAMSGNFAFIGVAGENPELAIYDLSSPTRPRKVGAFADLLRPFCLSITGPPGHQARVQCSDDLNDWQDWQTVTLGDLPLEVRDSDVGPAIRRFYRAVQVAP